MNNSQIESKLKENGFSDKDIICIKKWAEKENIKHAEAIKQIYKVFSGMALMFIFITAIAVYEYFQSDDFISFFIAYMITAVLFFIFAPIRLGAKVLILIKKHGYDYLL